MLITIEAALENYLMIDIMLKNVDPQGSVFRMAKVLAFEGNSYVSVP